MTSRPDDTRSTHAGDAPATARRRFLQVGAASLCAGTCAAVLVPGIRMIAYPLGTETVTGRGRFIAAGAARQFVEAVPVKIDLITERSDAWNRIERAKIGSVWVIRKAGLLTAFSAACPHLGCSVDVLSAKELMDGREPGFICRCHDSFFSAQGEATDGPSPRGLDQLEIREADGKVEIRFERFRPGTPEKTPV